MDAKERIYLQGKDMFGEWEGQTWCEDKINDTDVEYIRADIALEEGRKQGIREAKIAAVDEYSEAQGEGISNDNAFGLAMGAIEALLNKDGSHE